MRDYTGTVVERFFAAIGKPVPVPLTDEERREWEAAQDAADAEAKRIYGDRPKRAAT